MRGAQENCINLLCNVDWTDGDSVMDMVMQLR